MAKLLVHILGTILITSVLCSAQVPDPSETEVEASGDVNTTSSAVPSPSTMPTTPTPPLTPSTEAYLFRNENGSVCVFINASISFSVSYPHDSKQNETVQIVPVAPQIIANHSFCNGTAATLAVGWATDHVEQNVTMSFIFTTEDSKTWKLSSVNVTIPGDAFKGAEYPVGVLDAGIDQLMDMQDFQLSYLCDTGRNLSMEVLNTKTAPNATHYDVQITLEDFQVQAFQFKNSTLVEFDDFARCAEDIKGSKIVPIAVGAALAGLVIIVLIAYIIGRLRSRKQGSYEALS